MQFYIGLITFIICLSVTANSGGKWPYFTSADAEKEAYNLAKSTLFPKTLKYITKYYVEPERIDPQEMFKSSLSEVQKFVPEILVTFHSPTSFTVIIDKSEKKFSSPLKNLDDFWNVMSDVMLFIELNYKGDVELSDIESLAINGALKMLDPHSAFLTPDFYKEFKIDTGGHFGGLGIVITSKDGQLTVIAPIEDTPAWKAGIKSGDVITEIDDESTINMSLMKAVERLRGKVGSRVNLTIERKGRAAPFTLTLTRAEINIKSIKSTLIKDTAGAVAYIRIKRFQKDTDTDFTKALKSLIAEAGKDFRGLVIDLRNNPGGLLNEAVRVADAFLSEGVIVSTVGSHKRFIEEDAAEKAGTEPRDYPLIVLVNEGSASASEIVAGALQAYQRALVIGEATFGKGSVQSVYELGKNYALKLTIAQYLTAGKYSIQTVGITPDIVITPVTIDKEYIDIEPNKRHAEEELEKHLKQIVIPTAVKEKTTIRYYKPYAGEDDIEEMRKKEYESELDFKDDLATKLATKIILSSKSSDPKTMFADSKDVISQLEKQEQEKMSAKLYELGTKWEWEDVQQADVGKLSVSTAVKAGGGFVEAVTAGEEAYLVLNVMNTGKAPFNRLLGVIEAENPLLDEKEFAIGRLDPGQTLSRELKIKIPAGTPDKNIPFKINFKQWDKALGQSYASFLKIRGLPRPRFSFNFYLEKPETVGSPNPLPKGKNVPITVRVKNIGDGPTKDANVFISNKKNEKDLFIKSGRAKLGVIKPGETKSATFSFLIRPSAVASTFILELAVTDRELIEFISTDLKVTVESGRISPPAGVWYEGPEIKISAPALPIVTESEKYTLKGEITDNVFVKDYYVFVNDEKVLYRSNPHETGKLPFEVVFKLKRGENNLTVVSRDDNNLASVKSLVIQRGSN